MKAQASTLETEQIMIERGNPLLAVTQVTSQVTTMMLNEVNIDFRILGLQHSVVKQAESSRVRELVKKIENHPYRHALQLDPLQNKAYHPFSATTKKMTQDVATLSCLSFSRRTLRHSAKHAYHIGVKASSIVRAGISWKKVANRNFIVFTLDLLSIPEYVMKKRRLHGHRYGKAPERKEYHLVHNLK